MTPNSNPSSSLCSSLWLFTWICKAHIVSTARDRVAQRTSAPAGKDKPISVHLTCLWWSSLFTSCFMHGRMLFPLWATFPVCAIPNQRRGGLGLHTDGGIVRVVEMEGAKASVTLGKIRWGVCRHRPHREQPGFQGLRIGPLLHFLP